MVRRVLRGELHQVGRQNDVMVRRRNCRPSASKVSAIRLSFDSRGCSYGGLRIKSLWQLPHVADLVLKRVSQRGRRDGNAECVEVDGHVFDIPARLHYGTRYRRTTDIGSREVSSRYRVWEMTTKSVVQPTRYRRVVDVGGRSHLTCVLYVQPDCSGNGSGKATVLTSIVSDPHIPADF